MAAVISYAKCLFVVTGVCRILACGWATTYTLPIHYLHYLHITYKEMYHQKKGDKDTNLHQITGACGHWNAKTKMMSMIKTDL